jgi:T-complex protein 1 subunit zeta
MSSAISELSPNAEVVHAKQALAVNAAAAQGLSQVLASNLGPTGTLKLLVGGTIEQLKLTKDGLTLLKEMQIQHPTAALIARTATAQDDVTGDGTTSTVLLVGALLKEAFRYVQEGLHPRLITTGYDLARDACLEFLQDKLAQKIDNPIAQTNLLVQIATTSLGTKLDAALVPQVRVSFGSL